MSVVTVVGIDPGLVHTGVVIVDFDTEFRYIIVQHVVIGPPPANLKAGEAPLWVVDQVDHMLNTLGHRVIGAEFIESYRERGTSYGTNQPMRALLSELKRRRRHAKVIDNTGIKKVVRRPLLHLLGLHKFPTTHHQDLQSAARILVLGMLKDDDLNRLLTTVVLDHIDNGRTWTVQK